MVLFCSVAQPCVRFFGLAVEICDRSMANFAVVGKDVHASCDNAVTMLLIDGFVARLGGWMDRWDAEVANSLKRLVQG